MSTSRRRNSKRAKALRDQAKASCAAIAMAEDRVACCLACQKRYRSRWGKYPAHDDATPRDAARPPRKA